ncbi:MAG: ComEC/Rec2 family competence protein, partial [Muribaculaceae bacterium]|nr:ComEC/Rec2 family competence protein [Muribaculaceae bacterium]
WPLAGFGLRRGRWLAVIIVLWLYALLTGMSPSVVRAVVMYSAVMMAKMLDRPGSALNALALAALLILVFSPRQLFAPGFQLSFMAVAALITIPPLLPAVSLRHRVLRWLYYYIVYTLAATCGTMLLAAYYFHIVPVWFLAVNLPFAFLLPVFMVGCLVWLALAAIGLPSGILDSCLNGIADLMYGIAGHTSSLPDAAVDNVYLPLWALFAGYLGIILVIVGCRCRPRWPWLSGGVVCLLSLALSGWIDRPSGDTLFIARSQSSTDVVYTRDGRGHVVSSARPHELPDLLVTITSRYADFLGRRGITDIVPDNPSPSTGNLALSFGPYRLAVVNSGTLPCDTVTRFDYLIVCRGFTGDIVGLSQSVSADT